MKKLAVLALIFFEILIFSLTIKGNWGNPTPDGILNQLRIRGQPFELSPERGRYALATSLAEDHSFFLRKDIARYVTPDLGYLGGDKYTVLFSPGVSILATPLYLLGTKFNLSQVATFALSAIFAIANFLLIIKICRQLGTSFRGGLVAAFCFLFATTSFAYSVSFYQHEITTFLLLATTALLFSSPSVLKITTALFFSAGSFWIDSQNPIFFIPLGVYATAGLFDWKKVRERLTVSIKIYRLLALFGVVLALGSYVVYSSIVFHKPFQLSGTVSSVKGFDQNGDPQIRTQASQKNVSRFFTPRRMIHGSQTFLFSQDRGVIFYSPIALLGIPGLFTLYRREKGRFVVLLSTILTIFVLYTMWGDPWGGWAFGPRYLIPVFGLLSIPLAAAFDQFERRIVFKIAFTLLLIYSVAINLLGALTTNQVPPKIEAVPLGMKWTFLLNWDVLQSGVTSSFFYKSFLKGVMPLITFAAILLAVIAAVGLILIWFPQKRRVANG